MYSCKQKRNLKLNMYTLGKTKIYTSKKAAPKIKARSLAVSFESLK